MLAIGVLALAAGRLIQRWREEDMDHVVAVAVDWGEFRELAARTARPSLDLMRMLQAQGVTSLLIAPISLNELFSQQRVEPVKIPSSGDPWDATALRLNEHAGLAAQLLRELSARGVIGLRMTRDVSGALLSRERGNFSSVKDIAAGYDPLVLKDSRQAQLVPIFRIFEDSWISRDGDLVSLKAIPLSSSPKGILFSSDGLPGGLTAIPTWRLWLRQTGATQFLPEFRPAQAAWEMARAMPANTYRAHSIPIAELKDLKPAQQLARWRRAVDERSCRLLVVHVVTTDSLDSFLQNLSAIQGMLARNHWRAGFPLPRNGWLAEEGLQKFVGAVAAWAVAMATPLLALRGGLRTLPGGWLAFLKITCLTIAGGLLVAALAQNPETRLEIVPVRGIKAAFMLSWFACLGALYGPHELAQLLMKTVKRWEILAAGMAFAAMAYLVLRTGNAPSTWTHPGEIAVRGWLENALVARPRFKEFLIGHPALLLGLHLRSLSIRQRLGWDHRSWLWLGMLGQVSIVNTFCHLHSPLRFELLRTFNGLWLGAIGGALAIYLMERRWFREE